MKTSRQPDIPNNAHATSKEFAGGVTLPYSFDRNDRGVTNMSTRHWDDDDRSEFADPGGNSALRAASRTNPRNLPCPTCERPNMLTRIDRQKGYQCDRCADQCERGGF